MLTVNELIGFGAGGLPPDPNAAFLSALLLGRGADSTTQSLTDAGGVALTFIGATISTAQSRTYGSSVKITSAQFVRYASNTALALGTSNFSAMAWFYATAATSFTLFQQSGFRFEMGVTSGKLSLKCIDSGASSYSVNITSSGSYSLNSWNLAEYSRSGNNFTIRLNGVADGTATNAGTLGTSASNMDQGDPGSAMTGTVYVSDVLLYKGVCVNAADFAPPALGYADTYSF